MDEHSIRALVEQVRDGRLERRQFIARMVGLGLTAPGAAMILMHHGIAQANESTQVPTPVPDVPGVAMPRCHLALRR